MKKKYTIHKSVECTGIEYAHHLTELIRIYRDDLEKEKKRHEKANSKINKKIEKFEATIREMGSDAFSTQKAG